MRTPHPPKRETKRSVFTGNPLPARFDWEKKCCFEQCPWVVWDGCIMNAGCITHCSCPENRHLKRDPTEISEHLKKQKRWEAKNGRESQKK